VFQEYPGHSRNKSPPHSYLNECAASTWDIEHLCRFFCPSQGIEVV
jgi:hypothetical protein